MKDKQIPQFKSYDWYALLELLRQGAAVEAVPGPVRFYDANTVDALLREERAKP